MKRDFRYKVRTGYEISNGNGGSTYRSSCTYYDLYINNSKIATFDREWEMYEYINKTYYTRYWVKTKDRIKKLRAAAKTKELMAEKLERSLGERIIT